MTRLRTLLLDDELPALDLLMHFASSCPEIELKASCKHPLDALKILTTQEIDLLISDIRMPEMDGIELLRSLDRKPLCIFITADPGQAVMAYELDVIDYLVKPVSPDRFKKAVQKAVDFFQYNHVRAQGSSFLMLKADYKVNKIMLEDLIRVEGFGEYIKVVTQHKTYTVLQRLSDFETQYADLGFIRIHKSFVVLSQHIQAVKGQEVSLRNGSRLPVGRVYKSKLSQSF